MNVDRRDPLRPDRRKLLARVGGRRATDTTDREWLTVTAFAARYGVSRGTVYKWLAGRHLETYEQGTVLRVRNLPPDQHHPTDQPTT